MDAETRQARRYAVWAAILASALLHAGLIALALRHLGETPVFPPAPVMTVELVPWLAERRPIPKRAQPPPAAPSRRDSPEVLTRPAETQTAEPGAVAPPAGLDPGVRRALRGLTACDRLPRDERDACHGRLAARPDDPSRPPRLNLDPRGQFAENPEAYINRKPKNGCKLRAAGDPGLLGKDGARAAFSCAWDF